MRTSPIFLALITLTAGTVLFFYILAVIPRSDENTDAQNGTTLQPLDAPTVDFGNPMIGNLDALVRIVEFGDFQCEGCAQLHPVMVDAVSQYGDSVLYVWKDAPDTSVHADSIDAAVAARCAGEQGKFWNYHEMLFANQASINENAYAPFATALDLNVDDFNECFASKRTLPLVRRDREQAIQLGIDATPYLFINDRRVSGALSIDQLKGYIDTELAKVRK